VKPLEEGIVRTSYQTNWDRRVRAGTTTGV
jgi:hypothetical protein